MWALMKSRGATPPSIYYDHYVEDKENGQNDDLLENQ